MLALKVSHHLNMLRVCFGDILFALRYPTFGSIFLCLSDSFRHGFEAIEVFLLLRTAGDVTADKRSYHRKGDVVKGDHG